MSSECKKPGIQQDMNGKRKKEWKKERDIIVDKLIC